jgi:hypothetical protein
MLLDKNGLSVRRATQRFSLGVRRGSIRILEGRMPELTIVGVILLLWGIPIAAAVWALATLHRLRTTLDAMRGALERVEQSLARR